MTRILVSYQGLIDLPTLRDSAVHLWKVNTLLEAGEVKNYGFS